MFANISIKSRFRSGPDTKTRKLNYTLGSVPTRITSKASLDRLWLQKIHPLSLVLKKAHPQRLCRGAVNGQRMGMTGK